MDYSCGIFWLTFYNRFGYFFSLCCVFRWFAYHGFFTKGIHCKDPLSKDLDPLFCARDVVPHRGILLDISAIIVPPEPPVVGLPIPSFSLSEWWIWWWRWWWWWWWWTSSWCQNGLTKQSWRTSVPFHLTQGPDVLPESLRAPIIFLL